MPNFVLEIYSEEIPALMQRQFAKELLDQLTATLKPQSVVPQTASSYITPRRICLLLQGLPERSPEVSTARRGPRVGAPEKAIAGFARSSNVAEHELQVRDEPTGQYYFAETKKLGVSIVEVLSKVVPTTISSFRWPKSMRWNSDGFRWVRPIRSITAVVDCGDTSKTLAFEVGGIHACNRTRGHATMASREFTVSSFDQYKQVLAERFVILDSYEREAKLVSGAKSEAKRLGVELVKDEKLSAEIAGLVEWPVPIVGEIDSKFASLPEEILATTMRTHQKFMAAKGPKSNRITHFVVIANLEAADGGKAIANGNKRVLNARLEDAVFVWRNDLRRISSPSGIAEMQAEIDHINYHSLLGTLGAKVRRIQKLAAEIAHTLNVDAELAYQAAGFVKMDLVSETVGEFPELQGVIGHHFATALKLDGRLAAACEEHYLPAGANERVPSEGISVVVGIADRIDQLTGFFATRIIPSGSKDPFALRRAALGVIRLCISNQLRLRIGKIIEKAFEGFAEQNPTGFAKHKPIAKETVKAVLDFIHERLAVDLRSTGVRHDIVNACAAMPDSDDLTQLSRRVAALGLVLESNAGDRLLHGFRRANNILKSEEVPHGKPQKSIANEDAEVELFVALEEADICIETALGEERLEDAMMAMAGLSDPIDRFFEHVRVNSDDQKLRQNRLRLLAAVCQTIGTTADLTKIGQ